MQRLTNADSAQTLIAMKIVEDVLRHVADESRARVPTSFVIVGAVLALGLMLLAIYTLYALKLAPTHTETLWFASQEKRNQKLTQAQDGTVVTLVRQSCHGSCPAYSVSVNASGRVEFHGKAFVCDSRPAPILVDPSVVAQLVEGLTAVRFEKMPNYTRVDLPDSGHATITLKAPNTLHVVEHYHGDNAAPRVLNLIEERMDEVSESSRWVGVGKGSDRECTLRDGSKRPIARLIPNGSP